MKRQALTYEECSDFAKQSGVKTSYEWQLLINKFGEGLPEEVPRHPESFYGQQIMIRNWLPYNEARAIVKKYEFKSRGQFYKNYDKLKFREQRIPKAVEPFYKNTGWDGWRNFLGHNILSMQEVSHNALPLDKLKELVRKQGIKSLSQYKEWAKNCKIKGVVLNPHQTYKRKKQWTTYSDFFGYSFKNIKIGEEGFDSYEIVKKKAQTLGIKSKREWEKARGENKIPRGIPKNPPSVYKDWVSWGDWLGTNSIKRQKGISPDGTKFWSYKKSSNYLKKMKVQTKKQFNKLYKDGKIPLQIPRWPDGVYKEWKGYPAYFGTTRVSRKKGFKFASYKEAKDWARKSGIKGLRGWKKAYTSRKIPWKFPAHPYDTYKKDWISWNEFLGTNKNPWQSKNFKWRKYEDTKKYIQKLGIKTQSEYSKFCKSGKKPDDIPVNPNKIYGKGF